MARTNDYSIEPCLSCGRFIMPGKATPVEKVPSLLRKRGWVCKDCVKRAKETAL